MDNNAAKILERIIFNESVNPEKYKKAQIDAQRLHGTIKKHLDRNRNIKRAAIGAGLYA
jgi:hypothetical protein